MAYDLRNPGPIPVHPQPGFYETTVAAMDDEVLVDHVLFEQLAAEPRWTLEGANERATEAMLDDGWTTKWVDPDVNRESLTGMFLIPPTTTSRAKAKKKVTD